MARHEAHRARPRHVALRATDPARPPQGLDRSVRIRQVLDNLLANAIRHTPAGGEVLSAATTREPTRLDGAVQVTDAGPGVPRPTSWTGVRALHKAGDSRGSGLGLSIARDLVEAHGGTVIAGNDPTTGGARVTFTLPRVVADAESQEVLCAEEPQRPTARRRL